MLYRPPAPHKRGVLAGPCERRQNEIEGWLVEPNDRAGGCENRGERHVVVRLAAKPIDDEQGGRCYEGFQTGPLRLTDSGLIRVVRAQIRSRRRLTSPVIQAGMRVLKNDDPETHLTLRKSL